METREVYQTRRNAVVARIAADPESFNMEMWMVRSNLNYDGSCDTVACLAGHAIMEMGLLDKVRWDDRGDHSVAVLVDIGNGRLAYVDDLAALYLGIPERPADILFADFSLETVEQIQRALDRAPYLNDVA